MHVVIGLAHVGFCKDIGQIAYGLLHQHSTYVAELCVEIGSKVWLEGTNLKLPSNMTPKLSPRRYGPFEVVSQISHVAYRLRLPPTWNIHDVFHASLLTPYKETEQHGPNFLEPPPEIIEGEPEWEVERILQERTFGRWKKKQYLVRWKGYSPAHDSWVSKDDIHAPELIREFHRRSSNSDSATSINTLRVTNENIPSCPSTPTTSPRSLCHRRRAEHRAHRPTGPLYWVPRRPLTIRHTRLLR